VAVAASSGGGRAAGGERSGPAEVSRAPAPVAVAAPRQAPVQAGANERVQAGGQPVTRAVEYAANGRVSAAGYNGGTAHYAVRYGNSWTDPAGAGQGQRYYPGYQTYGRQNGSRYRTRSKTPYLARFYGGYYPIYVDVPIGGDYFNDAAIDAGYDGGPGVAPDSGTGVGPVIAPSTISVSPDDGSQANASDANGANPGPDAGPAANQPSNLPLGPDSLVEAVQTELTRRGYFQGKVDSMFTPDTEAALRHFQQDNYLAPTGHLNEPTLHALNLD
jgi:hypothetical protein